MFKTIFLYELKHWLKQPSVYVYAFFLFAISFITLSGMAGETADRFNERLVNAPLFLFDMTKRFMLLAFFLMPAVLGVAANRDVQANIHSILYAYPFQKRDYIFAKYLSALVICIGMVLMLLLGYVLGAQMPWVNPALVQDFNPLAYGQIFGLFLLPNIVLVSVLIFGVVLLSRNIYAGFAIVLLYLLIPQITGFLFSGEANAFWQSLFDPMGTKGISSFTKHWTVAEQNTLLLPMENVWIFNRLLWLSIAGLLFGGVYKYFDLHQTAAVLTFPKLRKNKETRKAKKVIEGQLIKVALPTIITDFSFRQQLKTLWIGAKIDFIYLITSRTFISLVLAGLAFVLVIMYSMNPRWETETFPMTWQILEFPSQFYSGVINCITFLYAGLLIHRERREGMNQLVDISPVPNWVLLGSKFLALIKMQLVLLFILMVGGMITQAYKGFYHFEIDQYLFNLYGINLIHFVIWAMLALFIQTLFHNPYVGFFLLLLAPIGFISLAEFGPKYLGADFLEQMQFRYNQAPGGVFGLRYSDMDGYGSILPPYFLYKLYWTLAGCLLLIAALLLWTRGLPQSFSERLQIARQRFKGAIAIAFFLCLIAFGSMGFVFFHQNNIATQQYTNTEKKAALSAAEKRYQRYEHFGQPKIVDVKINMDIFPKSRTFTATGEYIVVNKTDKAIDTLVINYMPNLSTNYHFNRETTAVLKDTIANLMHFDRVVLAESLEPNDTLFMYFKNQNEPTTLLNTNAFIKEQGTFLEDDIFPRFGNWLSFARAHYHLGGNAHKAHPSDTTVLAHSFMARDADHVSFEATLSTDKEQIAIAPGHLEKEWLVDDRRYFHYKMEEKIALSYLFMSGDYAIAKDQWEDINLAIYYDKKHAYNIDRMMKGMKAGLAYCSENFSPYQFQQIRIVEFSQTGGASAHGFPSVIPAGEGVGFIADVDDSPGGGVDYAFGTAVHEVAHQWWGHQVVPADVLGSKMVVESLAEYVNTMVKKHERGVPKMREFLKSNLKTYLQARTRDRRVESPIMYAHPDQNYIHYAKGSLVFYTLSEYLGEAHLNKAIKAYVEKVAFQENEYTTSIELVDFIRAATPDSLQYLIKDLFETVTLYDNKITNCQTKKLDNGQYEITLTVAVSKYRSGPQGTRIFSDNGIDSLSYPLATDKIIHSLPLTDYIEIGVFGSDKQELFVQKYLFKEIAQELRIVLDSLPVSVSVDPYFKLIDREGGDNWKGF